MSKKIDFEIKESVLELQSLRKQVSNSRLEKRLLFLILKNDSKFKTRENLAEYLSLSEATLRVWSKLYMKSGLDALLKISSGGANHTKITEALHKELELKLNDSACPLLGYNDAVNWVKKEFDIDIKYNTLRTYMKRHFGSKLKVPRKSHYRKDEQAIAVFKKPSI
jgi:transposase